MSANNTTHRPFFDGKLNGFWDSIKNSPYPLHYTLRWPWYFKNPSVRNHSGIKPKKDSCNFLEAGQKNDLKLLFAGDIMVLNGDKPPVLSPKLCNLISSSDLFIANLEAPLGKHKPVSDKKYAFRFHMPLEFLLNIQKQTGLPFQKWVLTNANNHSGDMGIDGFNTSIHLLEALGVHHVGHRDFTSPFRIIETQGLKIAVAGWTHWLNRDLNSTTQPVIDPSDIYRADINNFKQKNDIDFVIGLPHWEFEFQHFPKKKTRKSGERFSQIGFDLLVGSHPHVLQPYEIFDDKYCFYSLGNFCGLGVAKPVKIIPLLELNLAKSLETNAKTLISSFKIHYFYQRHHGDTISIVPLDEMSNDVKLLAESRINKVMERKNLQHKNKLRQAC